MSHKNIAQKLANLTGRNVVYTEVSRIPKPPPLPCTPEFTAQRLQDSATDFFDAVRIVGTFHPEETP